jgi:hypothetical protein
MATYYVRPDGNDSNTGLGPVTTQAWQTISKALGATGIGSGDTLYVAPGDYRQTATITVGGTYSAPTYVIGNPTASQFSGISIGRVLITNRLSNDLGNSAGTFPLFTLASKNYLQFSNFVFEQAANQNIFTTTDCVELRWSKCWFQPNSGSSSSSIVSSDTPANGNLKNYYITQCFFTGWSTGNLYSDASLGRNTPTSNWTYNLYIDRCVAIGSGVISLQNGSNLTYSGTGIYISNSTGISISANNIKSGIEIINCVGNPTATWSAFGSLGVGGTGVVSNCSVYGTSGFGGYTITNLRSAKYSPFNVGMERLWGLPQKDLFSADGLYTYATGTVSGAPAVDIYDVAWAGGAPNVGTYNNYTTTLTGQYNPTERNASAITIAPGSTSQSIELYLGATGLTFATSGLAAYFVRNREAPTPITLVTQTATGAWTSGGFAEISSSLVPGVYRLDVPNAAFAAGASDVTIVVRGASGTNGAVLTVTLSSGGLTAAQTADAVLDAVASTHNNIGSIGAFIQDKSGYSLATSQSFNTTGSVGSVAGNVTGNVVGTVGGVVGNITGSVATVANPDNIIDGVWDEQRTGHTAAGSFGEKLQTNALADEMLARDLGSGLNAGTAEERTVRSALRALRNKVNVGSSQMVVKKEDDSTDAWTATVTTTAVSSNVSGIDPN